jgi:hypothetical protein
MTQQLGIIRLLCLAGILTSAVLGTACFHRPYRAYDSYYNDYHRWNDREADYYRQWCSEMHRDPGRDFRKLSNDEQEEYWRWRHQHSNDRHHKHDKH